MTILASAIQNHQNKSSRALILKSIFEILQTASCQGIRVQSHRPILDIFSRIEDFEKNTLLQDLPIAIKDNFNVKSFTTTASSKILETYVSPYDATPVAKLREQNAILIPNINMDEFGMGSSMVNSSYGICRNPWSDPSTYLNDSHSPGGSSGANAAIVARGIVHASLASDTGGSVRQPASFCGVVGFKPTYGNISRHGLIAYASSMDTPGIIASNVMDAALVYDCISGHDNNDSMTNADSVISKVIPSLFNSNEANLSQHYYENINLKSLEYLNKKHMKTIDLKHVTIGIPKEFLIEEINDEIRSAWQDTIRVLEDAGAEVITVSIPTLKFALPCYYLLACAEASSNLVRYDGIRYGCNDLSSIFNHHSTTHGNGDSMNHNDLHEKNRLLNNYNLLTEYQMDYDQLISKFRALKFGHEVIKRILTGTFILSKNSIQEFFYVTNEIRKQLQYEYSQIFYHNRPIDMILCPTAPTLPYQYSNLPSAKDMLVNDLFTVSSNLIGNPSISLPITTTSAQSDTNKNHTNQPILPIGMQLMTSHHNEVLLFKVALAVEQRVEFFKKIPNHVKTGIVL